MSAAPAEFDLAGPLPSGVTLLEASAGTGKTFAIAALAARLVAAGTPLSELLLITFTRMATGELRERVRDQLVAAERGLARVASGLEPPQDAVVQLLARGTDAELALRHRLLADAVAGFDAATVTTIHGFCQQVLSELGVAADVDPDTVFVEDVAALVDEVVDDLYVQRLYARRAEPPFSRADALRVARSAVANPFARLAPVPQGDEQRRETWGQRQRFAELVRQELAARKRRRRLMSFDDLLERLRDTLCDPASGPRAGALLRQRFGHVLVDEFQDTDPVQWEILDRAFGRSGATLVLVGDPKQAIYAFRGADVFAYLDAAGRAASSATLAVNWRSDEALLAGFDALFGEARLGHPQIAYRATRAAPATRGRRLAGAPEAAPLRLRLLRRYRGLVGLTGSGWASAPAATELVAGDVAADIVRLLGAGAAIVEGSRSEPLVPRHLAVLVRTNRQAETVRAALRARDVPAVVNGTGSVFGTPAAAAWRRLLEALEQPGSAWRARAVALTPLVGWSAEQSATAPVEDWEDLHARLNRWADVLQRRGVAALFERVSRDQALAGRVLALEGGERALTDLRHLSQLLHAAATAEQLGVAALTGWLRAHMAGAEQAAEEDRALRLDSDAEAVQVLTVHRSKGLEFPVVYVPFGWVLPWLDEKAPALYHDAGEQALDVGGDTAPGVGQRRARQREEERGEELRLLYVAVTRARHQVVLSFAPSAQTRHSPLARLLLSRRPDGTVPALGGPLGSDDDTEARLRALAATAPASIAVELVDEPSDAAWAGRPAGDADLEAARLGRSIDARWTRTSYSALVAGQPQPQVASEPELDVRHDELLDALAGPAGAGDEALRAVALPLGDMPGGVVVGDLVHRVLEAADYAATDLSAELATRLSEQRARRDVDVGPVDEAVAGLRLALETPLGPLLGSRPLAGTPRRDRLDEVSFELPLVGGDAPAGRLLVEDVAALLERHLPAGDPLAAYPERLRGVASGRELRGYLTGVLDVVLRAPVPGAPRFVVVDYKTNRLVPEGEAPSAWHYRPAALADAMQRGHYVLQALLYLVALHRYLRWRVRGYEPGAQLGGVLYLFLRGMLGQDAPRASGQPCGVFAWQPPAGLVAALSELLDRGSGR